MEIPPSEFAALDRPIREEFWGHIAWIVKKTSKEMVQKCPFVRKMDMNAHPIGEEVYIDTSASYRRESPPNLLWSINDLHTVSASERFFHEDQGLRIWAGQAGQSATAAWDITIRSIFSTYVSLLCCLETMRYEYEYDIYDFMLNLIKSYFYESSDVVRLQKNKEIVGTCRAMGGF